MKVQINNKLFSVRWVHRNITANSSKMDKSPQYIESNGTKCIIDYLYNPLESGSKAYLIFNFGEAFLSKGDNFCKEKGRKVSLKRALQSFTKEERKIFWNAYLNK